MLEVRIIVNNFSGLFLPQADKMLRLVGGTNVDRNQRYMEAHIHTNNHEKTLMEFCVDVCVYMHCPCALKITQCVDVYTTPHNYHI